MSKSIDLKKSFSEDDYRILDAFRRLVLLLSFKHLKAKQGVINGISYNPHGLAAQEASGLIVVAVEKARALLVKQKTDIKDDIEDYEPKEEAIDEAYASDVLELLNEDMFRDWYFRLLQFDSLNLGAQNLQPPLVEPIPLARGKPSDWSIETKSLLVAVHDLLQPNTFESFWKLFKEWWIHAFDRYSSWISPGKAEIISVSGALENRLSKAKKLAEVTAYSERARRAILRQMVHPSDVSHVPMTVDRPPREKRRKLSGLDDIE